MFLPLSNFFLRRSCSYHLVPVYLSLPLPFRRHLSFPTRLLFVLPSIRYHSLTCPPSVSSVTFSIHPILSYPSLPLLLPLLFLTHPFTLTFFLPVFPPHPSIHNYPFPLLFLYPTRPSHIRPFSDCPSPSICLPLIPPPPVPSLY